MAEKNTEQCFLRAWEEQLRKMDELGIPTARMRKQAQEWGGVEAARRCLDGRRCSDGFSALREKKRLELSLEALALKSAFGALFTDDEVNEAIRRLMEADYSFR